MPKLDRLGRAQKDPHRLFHGIEGATWLAERMPVRQVPGAAWSMDADPNDADSHVAVVACPCGQSPVVLLLEPLLSCEGCERHYFFDSRDVWVFNSPCDRAEGNVAVTAPMMPRAGLAS